MSKVNKPVVNCDYSQPLPMDSQGQIFKDTPFIEWKIAASMPGGIIPGGFDSKNLSWLGGQKMQYNVTADPDEWEQRPRLKFEAQSPTLPECLSILDDWRRRLETGPLKVEDNRDDAVIVMDENGKLWCVDGLKLIAVGESSEGPSDEVAVAFSAAEGGQSVKTFAEAFNENLTAEEKLRNFDESVFEMKMGQLRADVQIRAALQKKRVVVDLSDMSPDEQAAYKQGIEAFRNKPSELFYPDIQTPYPTEVNMNLSSKFNVTGDNGISWKGGAHFKSISPEDFNAILADEQNFVIIKSDGVKFEVGEYLVLFTKGHSEPNRKISCVINHVSDYGLLPGLVLLRLEKTLSADESLERAKARLLEQEYVSVLANKVNVGHIVGVHVLKSDPAIFHAVESGLQTFELRYNDRNYQVDDVLILRETVFTGKEMADGAELIYTGRHLARRITYILSGYGLGDGWVVLGTVKEENDED